MHRKFQKNELTNYLRKKIKITFGNVMLIFQENTLQYKYKKMYFLYLSLSVHHMYSINQNLE